MSRLLLATTCALSLLGSGCELAASFDRQKIPPPGAQSVTAPPIDKPEPLPTIDAGADAGPDGGPSDGGDLDAQADASASDAGALDGGGGGDAGHVGDAGAADSSIDATPPGPVGDAG